MSPSLPASYSPHPATMPCCFLHQKVRPGFFCCIEILTRKWCISNEVLKMMGVLKQRDQKKQLVQSSLKNWFFFLYNRSWFFICFFILISISFVKGKEYQMQYFICFFIRLFFFQFFVLSFALTRLLLFLNSPILEKMVNNE